MKKILILAMLLGLFLLYSNLAFGGEWKILPFKFQDGTVCNIPSDWKLITAVGLNLWFQDKEGNVYLVKLTETFPPIVSENVYRIKSK